MKQAHPTLGKYKNNCTDGAKFGLNRALLPDVVEYPFHDDSTPSLRIHSRKGCFKCMSCEAKGGDLIAFHQKLTGKPFIEACKDLGAWENNA